MHILYLSVSITERSIYLSMYAIKKFIEKNDSLANL